MNKRVNTLLFILGAVAFNLLVMMILMVAGFVLVMYLTRGLTESSTLPVMAALTVVFVGSAVGTFYIYARAVKFLSGKIDFDKYFHPLISRRRR